MNWIKFVIAYDQNMLYESLKEPTKKEQVDSAVEGALKNKRRQRTWTNLCS